LNNDKEDRPEKTGDGRGRYGSKHGCYGLAADIDKANGPKRSKTYTTIADCDWVRTITKRAHRQTLAGTVRHSWIRDQVRGHEKNQAIAANMFAQVDSEGNQFLL
jgi:hypothetical protein